MTKKIRAKKPLRPTRDAVNRAVATDTQRVVRDALLHPVSQAAAPLKKQARDAIKKTSGDS